jgi:hypothetical protein
MEAVVAGHGYASMLKSLSLLVLLCTAKFNVERKIRENCMHYAELVGATILAHCMLITAPLLKARGFSA